MPILFTLQSHLTTSKNYFLIVPSASVLFFFSDDQFKVPVCSFLSANLTIYTPS